MTPPPLSLYIHVPWCVRKCPYCDFNSHAVQEEIPEASYLQALLEDLEQDVSLTQGRPIASVFIGGGTPSLMSPTFYQQLFDGLQRHLTFSEDAEITLEANPGTVEQSRFKDFRQTGINRLSIGVQSFDDAQLKTLGRIHDSQAAHRALAAARDAGFDNFNIDLMHGLPGQSVEGALEDLRQAEAHQPAHISWYQLTLEPNTEFYSRPPSLPEDDLCWEIYQSGADFLRSHGYQDYEVSAWGKPGRESLHNRNYWTFGDYLALGAGAHGKITLPGGQVMRYWKTRQPDAYLKRIGSRTAGQQTIETSELPLEFLMNALRLTEGVTEELFTKRTGLPIETVAVQLEELRRRELLEVGRIQTTPRGQRFLNSVLEHFL